MNFTLCGLLRINYRGARLDVEKPVRSLCDNSLETIFFWTTEVVLEVQRNRQDLAILIF